MTHADLVRDSSAVRQLFFFFARAVNLGLMLTYSHNEHAR